MNLDETLNRKIKYIKLINFQNHKYSKIDLTNGLNLLVGSSDSGKTAIARAIDFVMHNNSEGNDYVHIGEKFATVEIGFCDGSIIKRSKGDRLNKVEYKYPDDEEFTVRSSFGDAYKEDVLNFLGNPPKSKALGSMAYSNQSNKNFLVDLPESQLPGVISDLVGVSDLEEGSHLLSSKVKGLDTQIKSVEKEIIAIEKQLDEEFVGLDSDVKNIEKVKTLIDSIDQMEKEKLIVKNYQDKFIFLKTRGNEAKKDLDKSKKFVEIMSEKINVLDNLQTELNENNIIYQSYIKHDNEINEITKDLDRYNKICNGDIKNLIDSADDNKSTLSDMIDFDSTIKCNTEDIEQIKNEIKDQTRFISDIKKQLKDLIDEAKSKGFYCTSCNKIGGVEI